LHGSMQLPCFSRISARVKTCRVLGASHVLKKILVCSLQSANSFQDGRRHPHPWTPDGPYSMQLSCFSRTSARIKTCRVLGARDVLKKILVCSLQSATS